MRIRIEVGDELRNQDAARLTEALARWLEQDRSVGPRVRISRIRPQASDGTMSGDLVDWLGLVLNSGFSITSLVYSHLAFRASLPPRVRSATRLVIEHDGSRLEIESGSAEEVAQLVRLVGGNGLLTHPAPEPAAGTVRDDGADGAS
ncbi:effector-associated constant component EACC1 [Streptomyces composti]|uniref:effector-associated constant component EACC1 n=1 Tax=Streptomyces composti TaxID=2720025 RepID=UPI001F0E7FA0|nr:hypothetical protein [Streptomyces composti]